MTDDRIDIDEMRLKWRNEVFSPSETIQEFAQDYLDALDEIERLRKEYDDLQRRYSEEVQMHNRTIAKHMEAADD